MFLRILLLLTIVPLVELFILFRIAEEFEWGPTIALVVLTGILGAWLARREGLKALKRIQDDLASGVAPTSAMVDGGLILIAGVVLVTPGVLTDLCGFALLIAPCRALVRRRLADAFKRHVVVMHQDPRHAAWQGPGNFVDVDATSRDPDDPDHPDHPDHPDDPPDVVH